LVGVVAAVEAEEALQNHHHHHLPEAVEAQIAEAVEPQSQVAADQEVVPRNLAAVPEAVAAQSAAGSGAVETTFFVCS